MLVRITFLKSFSLSVRSTPVAPSLPRPLCVFVWPVQNSDKWPLLQHRCATLGCLFGNWALCSFNGPSFSILSLQTYCWNTNAFWSSLLNLCKSVFGLYVVNIPQTLSCVLKSNWLEHVQVHSSLYILHFTVIKKIPKKPFLLHKAKFVSNHITRLM